MAKAKSVVPEKKRELFELLSGRPAIVEWVKRDLIHAAAFYNGIQFRRIELDSGLVFVPGQRDAASIVAALRDVGETYRDFFTEPKGLSPEQQTKVWDKWKAVEDLFLAEGMLLVD